MVASGFFTPALKTLRLQACNTNVERKVVRDIRGLGLGTY